MILGEEYDGILVPFRVNFAGIVQHLITLEIDRYCLLIVPV
jgi:hypothetical protein